VKLRAETGRTTTCGTPFTTLTVKSAGGGTVLGAGANSGAAALRTVRQRFAE